MIETVATAEAGGHLPLVPVASPAADQRSGLEVRPAEIIYAPAEFLAGKPRHRRAGLGSVWAVLHWSIWTSHRAIGSGYDAIRQTECGPLPSCEYHVYPASIRLDRPRHEHGFLVFTKMRLTYTKKRPPDTARTRTFNVIYVAGAFDWNTPFF